MRPDAVPWGIFEGQAPEMAAFVRDRLNAHRHRLLATIRADGSPRISGTELLIHAGDIRIGGLPGSRKFLDLRRDPRMALHSAPDDPPAWVGDARLSGIAVIEDADEPKASFRAAWEAVVGGMPEGPFDLVRLLISEVSTVRVAPTGDHLVLEVWRPGEPVRSIERW